MKKLFSTVVAAMIMFAASFLFAGGQEDGNLNKNSNFTKQIQVEKQGQGQQQVNGGNSIDMSGNGGNINGMFPYAPQMPSTFPPGYYPGYEKQVNDMPLRDVVTVIGMVDKDSFNRFRNRLIKSQGEEFFAQLEKSIIIRPTMPKFGLFPETDKVYIVNDVPAGSIVEYVGFMTVDSTLDPALVKDRKYQLHPLTQELHMFAGRDVLQDGVNVMMPAPKSDFYRAYISPDGNQWGIGGSGGILGTVASWLTGFSISPQYTSSHQTTAGHGDKAITYICFRVPNLDKFLNPPKPAELQKPICNPAKIQEQINKLEQELKKCTQFCFNNLNLRSAIGDAYIELYQCTGDKSYLQTAIGYYQIAERNYRQGYDIKLHKIEADQIIARDYYNWAGCISELNGQGAAMSFANEKHLERIPTGFAR